MAGLVYAAPTWSTQSSKASSTKKVIGNQIWEVSMGSEYKKYKLKDSLLLLPQILQVNQDSKLSI